MINLAVSEENFMRADSLYRKLPRSQIDTLQFRLAHAYKTNDEELKRTLLDAYERSGTIQPIGGIVAMIYNAHDPEHFDRLRTVVLSSTLPPQQRARARMFAGAGLIEQGRIREGLEVLGPLEESKLNLINRITNVPMYDLPKDHLLAMRDQVHAMDSTAAGDTPAQQLSPQLRLYNLGVISCRLGDFTSANEYAQRLGQLPVRPDWAGAVQALATEISAQIDIENGRPAEGLRKLETIKDHPPLELNDVLRSGAPALMWKSEALFRAGRYEEAEPYFENLEIALGAPTPFAAWRILRLAEISDALGRHEEARSRYARFLRLFEKADPELQPIVRRARARLAELQEQAG